MLHLACRNRRYTPCDLSSYQPISNLSFLSKLLDHVVNVQLTEYLSSAGVFPAHQSACRKCHSTDTALFNVVSDLTEAIDACDHALLGLPSIRWTIMFWPSACRRRMGSTDWGFFYLPP